MQLPENKLSRSGIFVSGISFTILLIYFLNFFYNLNELVGITLILLLTGLGIVLLLRYKQFLLYSLSFLIPISVPLTIGGETKISAPSEIICALLSVFFFIKLWQDKKISATILKHPITLLIIADLVWLFITSLSSQMPIVSFKRVTIKLMYYICFYYFYYELFSLDHKNIRKIFMIHCIGFLVPIISASILHARLGFTTMGSQLTSAPFYNDHTMYGSALVFFLPFLFFNSFKKFSPGSNFILPSVLLIIFSVASFLSYSRAAWLSLIVSVVIGILIKLKPRMHHFVLLTGILLVVFFAYRNSISEYFTRTKEVSHNNNVGMHFKSISNINTDASNLERVNRWKCALRMFKDKPAFGFGPGTYQFFYGTYQVRKDMTHISTFLGTKGHAHSEYLNYLSETGLPGCLIFIALIATVILTSLKVIKKSTDKNNRNLVTAIMLGLLTYFIHAFFNGFIEFEKIAMPVFMSMAAITYLDISQKKKENGNDLRHNDHP